MLFRLMVSLQILQKVEVHQNYPVPNDLNVTKSFVSFANYYSKFVKNFSKGINKEKANVHMDKGMSTIF